MLLRGHVAHRSRGHADHDRSRRDVAGHDGAGPHEGLRANLDSGKQHCTRADPAAAPQRRAAQLDALRAPARRRVVREHHTRRDEDVVLDQRPCGHVGARLHAHALAHPHVVLDRCRPTDHRLRADLRALAHVRLVGDDRPLADLRSGQHDRAGADRRTRPDDGGRGRLDHRGTRARSERRRLADHAAVLQHDALAHHGARMHDHVAADLDGLRQLGSIAEQQARGALRRRRPGTHRRTRFAASIPRVTPRKSTTSGDSRTTRSRSRPGCAVTITEQSGSSGHSELRP